jgi:hypothetical protein
MDNGAAAAPKIFFVNPSAEVIHRNRQKLFRCRLNPDMLPQWQNRDPDGKRKSLFYPAIARIRAAAAPVRAANIHARFGR